MVRERDAEALGLARQRFIGERDIAENIDAGFPGDRGYGEGKESTFVGLSIPRQRALSARKRGVVSEAEAHLRALRRNPAAFHSRGGDRFACDRARPRQAAPQRRGNADIERNLHLAAFGCPSRARAFISLDDLAHKIVADHVDMGEADVADARDRPEEPDRVAEPRFLSGREVGLASDRR